MQMENAKLWIWNNSIELLTQLWLSVQRFANKFDEITRRKVSARTSKARNRIHLHTAKDTHAHSDTDRERERERDIDTNVRTHIAHRTKTRAASINLSKMCYSRIFTYRIIPLVVCKAYEYFQSFYYSLEKFVYIVRIHILRHHTPVGILCLLCKRVLFQLSICYIRLISVIRIKKI